MGRASNSAPVGSGTGLKYVQARLEENFPSEWSLDEGKANAGEEGNEEACWLTTIVLPLGEP